MKKHTIGIDVGGTNIKLGIVSSTGKIVSRSRLNTSTYGSNKGKLINALVDEIQTFIKSNDLTKRQIEGIGIGLPGLIDSQKGVVTVLPNIAGWKNVQLKSILEKKLRIRTFLDNDVNVISLAEWKYGAGKGYNNLLCITLGTGVGGGLILNGSLYRGENFVAGEIGHFPYKSKELEYYIGNKYLLKRARRILGKKIKKVSDVYYLAKAGNKKAIKSWDFVGEQLGTVLSGVLNILNPQLVILGGGVSNNFPFFLPKLKQTIKEKTMVVQARNVKIIRAKLGDDAGIIGGQILVREGKSGKKN